MAADRRHQRRGHPLVGPSSRSSHQNATAVLGPVPDSVLTAVGFGAASGQTSHCSRPAQRPRSANAAQGGMCRGRASWAALQRGDRRNLSLFREHVELLDKGEDVLFAAVPGGGFIARRPSAARERSPERLHLDRRGLTHCPRLEGEDQLRLLNYQSNSIARIENMACTPNLVFLDFYDNQLSYIEQLEHVPHLRVLMVGKNEIAHISNLHPVRNLDVLDLHNNQIEQFDKALQPLQELRVLNVAGNNLSDLSGLESVSSLTELNIRRNNIANADGLEHLSKLVRLFASHNKFVTFSALMPLSKLRSLSELALEGNPICQAPDYIARLQSMCNVEQLDGLALEEVPVRGGVTDSSRGARASLASRDAQSGEQSSFADHVSAVSAAVSAAAMARGWSPNVVTRMQASKGQRTSSSRTRPQSAGPAWTKDNAPMRILGLPVGQLSVTGNSPMTTTLPSSSGSMLPPGEDQSPLKSTPCTGSQSSSAAACPSGSQIETIAPAGNAGSGKCTGKLGSGLDPLKKPMTGAEVLKEIQAQWASAVAEGTGAPTTRYGYVRREKAKELAICGRGLDALDKTDYQTVVTTLQFNFISVETVLKDLDRIARFGCLTSIVFTNNQIFSPAQLEPLRQLTNLVSLTIRTNPICAARSSTLANLIWHIPGLETYNGVQISAEHRICTARVYEPLCAAGSQDAPETPVPNPHSDRAAWMLDELVSHACSVDEKMRAVQDCFDDTIRGLIGEAWEDVVAMAVTSHGGCL